MKLPTINRECMVFLLESGGRPLIRHLPSSMDGFSKVKVRKRKKKLDKFEETFNEAFFTEYEDLRSRAVFVRNDADCPAGHEPFYIFPPDGFRFMYSPTVADSTNNFRETFNLILDAVDATENGLQIFKEMVQLSYKHDDLISAIDGGSELIIYDIPYFYAVRKELVDDYAEWFYHSDS